MEFRLIYSGRLPAETDKPRPEAKHAIRKHFSPQILNLWSEHPLLSWRGGFGEAGTERAIIEMDEIANKFKQISRSNHIWKFLPLIRREDFVSCELDILFLRRGGPGGLIKRGSGGGDLDNRIKVLFDALRIPDASQEVDDREQQSDEDPLYCLLENDELIDRFRVTTDRLLTPLGTDHINDVHIVIHVKTQVLNFKRADVSLW